MRTTVTLDDALEDRLRKYASDHSIKFKKALNDILKKGLDQTEVAEVAAPYKTKPKKVGLRKGPSYDNVNELLEQVEGPKHK